MPYTITRLLSSSNQKLVKILIGSAWLDGRIQPEERQYLQQIVTERNLDTPEIQHLLHGLKAVTPTELYTWVKDYLGDRPSVEDCQNLIESVSGLIYSDGEVAIAEAKLLTKLQSLHPEDRIPQSKDNFLLKEIQKLYRSWVDLQT